MFLDLLPELQEQVITYCSVRDLKNLSRTSWTCNKLMEPHLLHTVRIPDTVLAEGRGFLRTWKLKKKLTSRLQRTKVLRIAPQHHITKTVWKAVCSLHHLQEVDMSYSDRELNVFMGSLCDGLPSLKSMNLTKTTITYDGCCHLTKLKSLEKLSLGQCEGIDNATVASLSQVASLKYLDVSSCSNIVDVPFVDAKRVVGWEHLVLTDTNVADQVMASLASATRLKTLDVSRCHITDHGIAAISHLHSLRELDVSGCRVGDRACSHVSKLKELQVLNMNGCNVSNEGCSMMRNLSNLTQLHLSNTSITDVSLTYIASHFIKLRILNVSYCNVTDEVVPIIRTMCLLKELNVEGCYRLSNACLNHFRNKFTLKILNLYGCQVTVPYVCM